MARTRLAAAFVVMGLTLAAVPAFADARGDSKAQVDFGIKAAQRELWKEALYRWKRAVEIDPTYAAAYNNLAIAYEHDGQFDEARGRLREGARARAEQRAHQAELRSVPRNQ